MAEYLATDSDMTKVADAIRAKGGTTAALAWPDGYKKAIDAIQTGGGGGEEVDISFIVALNESSYNGGMNLEGVFGKLECDFNSNRECHFELSNQIPIKEFFNDTYIVFDTLPNVPMVFSFGIANPHVGRYGLRVVLLRA